MFASPPLLGRQMNDNEELDSVENTESEQPIVYAAKKRRVVMLLLVYSAILGILFCFLPEEDTPIDFIVTLPLLILAISWCFTDAAERDHRIGPRMRLLLILLFIVGLPIYLFQTRGIGAIKTLASLRWCSSGQCTHVRSQWHTLRCTSATWPGLGSCLLTRLILRRWSSYRQRGSVEM